MSEVSRPPQAPQPPYTFTTPLPADHFVSQFIAYAAQCVDGPHEYLETTGLIMLATATPRVRARLRQYPRGLPTAFYAICLGDSTRSRKSTAARLGTSILDDAVPESRLAEQASPEAFVEQIATGRQTALWYCDEIGETLDKLYHAPHMAGLRGLLLELYEGNSYRYNIAPGGRARLAGPIVRRGGTRRCAGTSCVLGLVEGGVLVLTVGRQPRQRGLDVQLGGAARPRSSSARRPPA